MNALNEHARQHITRYQHRQCLAQSLRAVGWKVQTGHIENRRNGVKTLHGLTLVKAA